MPTTPTLPGSDPNAQPADTSSAPIQPPAVIRTPEQILADVRDRLDYMSRKGQEWSDFLKQEFIRMGGAEMPNIPPKYQGREHAAILKRQLEYIQVLGQTADALGDAAKVLSLSLAAQSKETLERLELLRAFVP